MVKVFSSLFIKATYSQTIIFAVLISIFNEISSELDFELINSLREYFQSDVILLAKKENNGKYAK